MSFLIKGQLSTGMSQPSCFFRKQIFESEKIPLLTLLTRCQMKRDAQKYVRLCLSMVCPSQHLDHMIFNTVLPSIDLQHCFVIGLLCQVRDSGQRFGASTSECADLIEQNSLDMLINLSICRGYFSPEGDLGTI